MFPTKRIVIGRIRKSLFTSGRHLSSGHKSPHLVEVGYLSNQHGERYEPGQLFLNRTFAYRGVIVASFDCKEFKRKENNQYSVVPYYQALIHRGDWKEVRFPIDHTSFLSDSKEGKVLNSINGLDCVMHGDILPLSIASSDEFKPPIDHELFSTLFKLADDSKPELGFVLSRTLNKKSSVWLQPQMTHFESTESIAVMLTTYYLGQSTSSGQSKYFWRYVIRIENQGNDDVVLRERHIKIFSLNNLTQVTAQGVCGEFPTLSSDYPAYQFSSTIDLPQRKSGHLWGKLLFQRADASTFEVDIPTVVLECNTEINASQTSENNAIH